MTHIQVQDWRKCVSYVIIIVMEIYAAPKLSKYMTALNAYNDKSFTYKINYTHTHTHTHTHTTHTPHSRTHTQARSKKFLLRKIRQGNKGRRLETSSKEMGFQCVSK